MGLCILCKRGNTFLAQNGHMRCEECGRYPGLDKRQSSPPPQTSAAREGHRDSSNASNEEFVVALEGIQYICSISEIRDLLRKGQASPSDWVWHVNHSIEWKPLSSILPEYSYPPPPQSEPKTKSHRQHGFSESPQGEGDRDQ